MKGIIDSILFVPELTVYDDYKWIANFYKDRKNEFEIREFSVKLEDYFNSLKHYSIRNSVPKSNVLIVLYILNNYTSKEIANSLLKNAKYSEYIDYVINISENYMELYNEVMKRIKNNYLVYKRYLPDLLHRFVYADDFVNEKIYYNFGLYSFLCSGKVEYLGILDNYSNKNIIIKDVENATKNVLLLSKLYKYYNETNKLWDLLNNDNNRYLIINNIDGLKEKYGSELYNYFIEQFYEILKIDKKREIYQKASLYVKAIYRLNNGELLVNELIKKLRTSEYQKCTALFDEIYNVLKNK